MAHGGKPDPIGHVVDSNHHNNEWVFFEEIFTGHNKVDLGTIPFLYTPHPTWVEGSLKWVWEPFQITKFMIIEVIAAALVVVIFIGIARLVKDGKLPKGPFWNFFEGILTFVRDNLAKPYLKEDTDKFVPFLWTLFTFILFCNLLGLVPFLGSPTGSIYMTIGLAIYCLILFHGAAIAKLGLRRYLSSMWLHIEIVPHPLRKPGSGGHGHGHDDHGHDDHHAAHAAPAAHAHDEVPWTPPTGGKLAFGMVLYAVGWLFGNLISLLIFGIEFMGTFIRSVVLALRLFVNMFAGHVIIASILLLIVMVGNTPMGIFTLQGSLTTVLAVLGVTGLSLLELFVAFLQAYVFTFLTALFLGMALHPAH